MGKILLTKEQKIEILSISHNHTSLELSKMYNCSRSLILKIWMDNNYHKPTGFSYYINENYFEKVDTQNKAYILGFLASDGCLYKRKNNINAKGWIRLTLHNKDEYILKLMLNDMDATYPVKTIKRKNGVYSNFNIVNEKIFQDLVLLGLHPAKTWTLNLELTFEKIPKYLWMHFLRGYFDGDGSITETKDRLPSGIFISFVGAYNAMQIISNKLKELNIDNTLKEDNTKKYSDKFGIILFNGSNKKYIFLKYLYENKKLYLERKFDRANYFFYLIENNISNRSENKKAVKDYEEFLNNKGEFNGEINIFRF